MHKVIFAAAAIPMFMAGAALAQNTSPPPPGPANTPPAEMSNPPPPAQKTMPADMPAKGPTFIAVPGTAMLSQNIVGLDIYNTQNNDIGKIHDVVIGSDESVKGFILSVGGFLGMGTHYVAVDPAAVSITYDSTNGTWRAAMNATKDELKAAPEFKYGGRWTASKS